MSEFIRSVTEGDFEYEVVAYSQTLPVIVEFWAGWSKPSKLMTPILEKITLEAEGTFRLARVDVDAFPNLPLRYGVFTIPALVAFSQGARVNELVGLQTETRIREFIQRILPPSPAHLMTQKGDSLFASQDLDEAEEAYEDALEIDNDYAPALLGMMRVSLRKGDPDTAKLIFASFPMSREYERAELLLPVIKAMQDLQSHALPIEKDLDAAFSNSIRLAMRGNLLASLDGMLDILREEKHYGKDRAKQVLLGLFELLSPESDLVRQYRKELASILF
jgi:putative thioredoxin